MKRNLILNLMFCLFLLSGCEKETDVEPVNTLQANAGSDLQEVAGNTVTLDGSASKDVAQGSFQHSWTLVQMPANSQAALQNANQAVAKFTPDLAGSYTAELRIYNSNFEDKDQVSIMVTEANNGGGNGGGGGGNGPIATILSDDITQERRLTDIFQDPGKPDYLVTNDIHVKAHLIIDGGVVIAFEQDKAMYIDNPGSIQTLAQITNPVFFTGKEKTPGFWKGLVINSSSSYNLLEAAVIEYGGSNPAYGTTELANLTVDNTGQGRLTLKYSTIQNSAGYGMVVESGAFLSNQGFSNIFTNNQKTLLLPASQVTALSALNYYYGNVQNQIEVSGGIIGGQAPLHWPPAYTNMYPATTVPYVIEGKLEIQTGLQIHPGSIFYMKQNSEILVGQNGYLIAVGNQNQPVVFAGQQVVPGFWKGIGFRSASPLNELKYATVSEAGSDLMYGFDRITAVGVDDDNQAQLKISITKIVNSGGYGLFLERNAVLGHLGFVDLSYNLGKPAGMSANHVKSIQGGGAISMIGNELDAIEIYESILYDYNNENIVWPALGGSYYYISGNLDIRANLNIAEGAAFKIAQNKYIKVTSNGYLKAIGTETAKIKFYGLEAIKGYWDGILFQTNSTNNFLKHVEVMHAGQYAMPGIFEVASIGVEGDFYANLTIANTKIAHGLGYGVVVESGPATINQDFETVNIFEDLDLGKSKK